MIFYTTVYVIVYYIITIKYDILDDIRYIKRWIPLFSAILDAAVRIEQLCLSSIDHRFYLSSTSKLICCIGSVQFVFWTLTYRAVVGGAHGRVRNLKPVHAQEVPETPPLPHLSVCKSEMPVHRTQLIDLGNDRVHAAVVEVQAPVNSLLCNTSWMRSLIS